MEQVKATKNDVGKRIDVFVRKYLKNAPLSFVYKLFRQKDIKVNKKPVKQDYTIADNDVITIYISEAQFIDFNNKEKVVVSTKQDFSVVYEDNNILVVNKPSNLLVHKGEDDNEDDLIKQVLHYLINNGSYNPDLENVFVPGLAHRIDRNTSGIVVIGKSIEALRQLFDMFKNHELVDKRYVALISGKLDKSGTIDLPLHKDEKRKLVNVDKQNGLKAITKYEVCQQFNDCALVDIKLITGRTHQIRAHFKAINHPLVGDKKYGNPNSDMLAKKYHINGYFLHAKQIKFKGFTNELEYLNNKDFVAPLYKWQKDLIDNLEK